MAPSLRALLQNLSSLLPHLSPITNDITSTTSTLTAPSTTYEPLSGAPQCQIDGSVKSACCHVYPSSRLLLTQFWDDTVHAPGAEEDWTLHGLWYVLSNHHPYNPLLVIVVVLNWDNRLLPAKSTPL